ncbi:phage protein NinX family protein [Morganella morganii]
MNKYRDKSDFEINKAVAKHVGGLALSLAVIDEPYKPGWNPGKFDPCNNPSDAMPIVIENGISLFAPGLSGMWTAGYVDYETDREYGVDNYEAINKNPYRAAMEVFLMMKDTENE